MTLNKNTLLDKKRLHLLIFSVSALLLSACQTQPITQSPTIIHTIKQSNTKIQKIDALYIVANKDNLYVFNDKHTFLTFLKNKTIAYRHTYIGAAPNEQNLIFGLKPENRFKTAKTETEALLTESKNTPKILIPYIEYIKSGHSIFLFHSTNDFLTFYQKGLCLHPTQKQDLKGKNIILCNINDKTLENAILNQFRLIHNQ